MSSSLCRYTRDKAEHTAVVRGQIPLEENHCRRNVLIFWRDERPRREIGITMNHEGQVLRVQEVHVPALAGTVKDDGDVLEREVHEPGVRNGVALEPLLRLKRLFVILERGLVGEYAVRLVVAEGQVVELRPHLVEAQGRERTRA